jgi:hypothetical protein
MRAGITVGRVERDETTTVAAAGGHEIRCSSDSSGVAVQQIKKSMPSDQGP